jgi:hypothetical protein
MIDEKRTAALRLFGDRFLSLTFGTDKQNSAPLPGDVGDEPAGFAEHLQGFLQVDDVNAIASPRYIPSSCSNARLVTEMNTGLQQLLHGDFYCHFPSLLDGCFSFCSQKRWHKAGAT